MTSAVIGGGGGGGLAKMIDGSRLVRERTQTVGTYDYPLFIV